MLIHNFLFFNLSCKSALCNFGGPKWLEKCCAYIDHVYKSVPVCVLMKGNATGDVPKKLFSERSRGKSIGHFNNLLTSDKDVCARASNLLQPWMWNCVYCARNVEQNFWLWFCVQFLIRYKTQSIVICNNLNKSLCPLTARCSCRKQSLNVNFVEINV